MSAIDDVTHVIKRYLRTEGDYQTPLSTLAFFRRHVPTEPIACTYPLGLAFTVQGEKQVIIDNTIINYSAGQGILATTVEKPIISHVIRATPNSPYLGFFLRFDPEMIALAANKIDPQLARKDLNLNSEFISISALDPFLFDAVCRLIKLLDDPILLPSVAPLIQEEIILRLLREPYGSALSNLIISDPLNQRINRIVTWLKQNFTQHICIDTLAAQISMSPSTFRSHFRIITGVSPLQFQKKLRLQEAHQLIHLKKMTASCAAFSVGYESPSQFSREYKRFFGVSPQRDTYKRT